MRAKRTKPKAKVRKTSKFSSFLHFLKKRLPLLLILLVLASVALFFFSQKKSDLRSGILSAESRQGVDGTWCEDSDGNGGGAMSVFGTCRDNAGTHNDYCENEDIVRDYYCTGTWNGSVSTNVHCAAGGYGCLGYTKSPCSNGVCTASMPTSPPPPTQPPVGGGGTAPVQPSTGGNSSSTSSQTPTSPPSTGSNGGNTSGGATPSPVTTRSGSGYIAPPSSNRVTPRPTRNPVPVREVIETEKPGAPGTAPQGVVTIKENLPIADQLRQNFQRLWERFYSSWRQFHLF